MSNPSCKDTSLELVWQETNAIVEKAKLEKTVEDDSGTLALQNPIENRLVRTTSSSDTVLLDQLHSLWGNSSILCKDNDLRNRTIAQYLDIILPPLLVDLQEKGASTAATSTTSISLCTSYSSVHPLWRWVAKVSTVKERLIQPDILQVVVKFSPSILRDLLFRASSAQKWRAYECLGTIVQKYLEKELPNCVQIKEESVKENLDLKNSSMKHLWEAWAAVLWNWSVDENVCLQMLSSNSWWEPLQYLLQLDCLQAQRNAASCLGTMISLLPRMEVEVTPPDWVLPFVTNQLEQTRLLDHDLQRRYMRTLRCWSSSTYLPHERTPHVCLAILQVSQIPIDTRIQACQTISNLLSKIHSESDVGRNIWTPIWPHLETVLLRILSQDIPATSSHDEKLFMTCCQTLTLCVQKCPWKRRLKLSKEILQNMNCILQRHIGLYHPSPSKNENFSLIVARCILHWVYSNVSDSLTDKETFLSLCTTILAAPSCSTDIQEARLCLVTALTHVAEAETFYKQALADDENLLSACVNVCMVLPESKLKDSTKKLVLELVQYL